MKVVKFKKHFDVYVAGEIAGLDDKQAEEALKSGAAVEYKEGKNSFPDNVNANATDDKAKTDAEKQAEQKRAAETKAVHSAPENKTVKTPEKDK